MKKRLLAITITAIILLSLLSIAASAQDVYVEIEGEQVIFTGQQPIIINSRTLIPLRGVFENLGFEVDWEIYYENTATVFNDYYTVHIPIGSSFFTVNGEEFALDVPAQLINDRTMLPIRFVLEAVGFYVAWHAPRETVMISFNPIDDVLWETDYYPHIVPLDEDFSLVGVWNIFGAPFYTFFYDGSGVLGQGTDFEFDILWGSYDGVLYICLVPFICEVIYNCSCFYPVEYYYFFDGFQLTLTNRFDPDEILVFIRD